MSLSRALVLAPLAVLVGLCAAAAQSTPFPAPPGQGSASQSSAFPPPPGQSSSNQSAFPPPPGQRPAGAAQGSQGSSAFPPVPGQSRPTAAAPAQPQAPSSPFAAPASQNPFAPSQPQGRNICEQFPALRAQAEKDANAIKTASERSAQREEICAAFNRFAASEGKMVKFLETNQSACGVPNDAIKQVKSQHARTAQIRKQVCTTAQAAPRGPSLSDALSAPALSDQPPKPGRGTFDTLSGSALSR